jgi:hypothetical protein
MDMTKVDEDRSLSERMICPIIGLDACGIEYILSQRMASSSNVKYFM